MHSWARSYIRDGVLWIGIGKGDVVSLPPAKRDSWWQRTTREWPFMAADLGISQEALMTHYLSNRVAVAALSQELGFRVRVLSRAS